MDNVKRPLLTFAALALLALLVVAAPALSLRPYRPHAVDFEVGAPEAAVSAAGLRTVTLRAPKRFDLVGFRWRGASEPGLRIRTRKDGGAWSRWTVVPTHSDDAPDIGSPERARASVSAPVWSGRADWVQYRVRGRTPGLRLHFVNVTGTTTALERLKTSVRKTANRATLALFAPAVAKAQAAQPAMVARADWGAADCVPRRSPEYGEVKVAFIHHTVSTNDYTPEDGRAAVLAICRYHRNSNGWNDIGYNFLVDKYGTIYEGRAGGIDQAVVGAQAQGYNSQSTGIANIGTYSSVPLTPEAISAIASLLRWKLPLHAAPTTGDVLLTSAGGSTNRYPSGTEVTFQRISGHRDADNTSCPGDAAYAQLPEIRSRVGDVTPRRPRTKIAASAAPTLVNYDGAVKLTGVLKLIKGDPVAGATVEIQQFTGGAWATVGSTTSRGDGSFEGTVSATERRILRARFPGDGTLLPSTSRQSLVKVRARLTVKRSTGKAQTGQTPVISGGVAPPKSKLVLVVQRREGKASRTVARVPMRAKKGRYRKGFRVRIPGLYRFYVVFGGDTANLPSQSPGVYVRVTRSLGGAPAGF